MTNPPYSGEHKPRLLEFLKSQEKPFAILLPVYTATKSYWKSFITPLTSTSNQSHSHSHNKNDTQSIKNGNYKKNSSSSSIITSNERNICYILPPNEYMYYHPEGTGKDKPPFYSAWFIGNMPLSNDRLRLTKLL